MKTPDPRKITEPPEVDLRNHICKGSVAKAKAESITLANVKIPKRFKKAKPNKWEQPVMNGYLMKCCDCGLIHEVDFRIAYGAKEKDNRVQLRMRRLNN